MMMAADAGLFRMDESDENDYPYQHEHPQSAVNHKSHKHHQPSDHHGPRAKNVRLSVIDESIESQVGTPSRSVFQKPRNNFEEACENPNMMNSSDANQQEQQQQVTQKKYKLKKAIHELQATVESYEEDEEHQQALKKKGNHNKKEINLGDDTSSQSESMTPPKKQKKSSKKIAFEYSNENQQASQHAASKNNEEIPNIFIRKDEQQHKPFTGLPDRSKKTHLLSVPTHLLPHEEEDDEEVSQQKPKKKSSKKVTTSEVRDESENQEQTKKFKKSASGTMKKSDKSDAQKSQQKKKKKTVDFKEDQLIGLNKLKFSLTNLEVEEAEAAAQAVVKSKKSKLKVDRSNSEVELTDTNTTSEVNGQVNDYEISWSFYKFFTDSRIRIREKFLFGVTVSLMIADMIISLIQFISFARSSCFGYESETELSDYLNIGISLLLKACCVNIIMQEITNTLPGIIRLPFFIPTVIMGIVPNLQLNQFVYSFSSCEMVNPVIGYRTARGFQRWLCYSLIIAAGIICLLTALCRIKISRSVWKKIKNIGAYILFGGFGLLLIFMFIFVSVLQIEKEFILALCFDNIVFWIYLMLSVFFSVRKIKYNIEPFPFEPQESEKMIKRKAMYAQNHKSDIESKDSTPKSHITSEITNSNSAAATASHQIEPPIVSAPKKDKQHSEQQQYQQQQPSSAIADTLAAVKEQKKKSKSQKEKLSQQHHLPIISKITADEQQDLIVLPNSFNPDQAENTVGIFSSDNMIRKSPMNHKRTNTQSKSQSDSPITLQHFEQSPGSSNNTGSEGSLRKADSSELNQQQQRPSSGLSIGSKKSKFSLHQRGGLLNRPISAESPPLSMSSQTHIPAPAGPVLILTPTNLQSAAGALNDIHSMMKTSDESNLNHQQQQSHTLGLSGLMNLSNHSQISEFHKKDQELQALNRKKSTSSSGMQNESDNFKIFANSSNLKSASISKLPDEDDDFGNPQSNIPQQQQHRSHHIKFNNNNNNKYNNNTNIITAAKAS